MTDTNPQYQKLTKELSGTRKTLAEACETLNIDPDDIDDELLEHHCCECSNCGIWGTDHRTDRDGFAICKVCFQIIGR